MINPEFGLPAFQTKNGYDFSVNYFSIPISFPPWNGTYKGYFMGLFKNLDADTTQDVIFIQVDPNAPGLNGIPVLLSDDIVM